MPLSRSCLPRVGHLILVLPLLLASCGWIEPSESDLSAALLHRLAARYGGGAQIEYIDKIHCHRQFRPAGYFCRFRVSTNTPLPAVNQGLFYYHHGWRVKNLTLNPKFPD